MFDCCDRIYEGDKFKIYDCKTNLPGGGTCTDEESCKENFKKGAIVVEEAAKAKNEETDDGIAAWIIIVIVVGSLLCIVLIVFAILTKCFKQSPCHKSNKKKSYPMKYAIGEDEEV